MEGVICGNLVNILQVLEITETERRNIPTHP